MSGKINIIVIEYQNGKFYCYNYYDLTEHEFDEDDLVKYCLKNQGRFFFILYRKNDVPSNLRSKLENNNLKHLFYPQHSNSGNNDNTNAEILSHLINIEGCLNKGNSGRTSFFSQFSRGECSETIEKADLKNFDEKLDSIIYIVNELYSQSPNQDNPASAVIDDLMRELSSYKNDFYLKSMQKYGVDIAINIIKRLYDEKRDIKRNFSEDTELLKRYENLIGFCQAEFKKLNLKFVNSKAGDQFDAERMKFYEGDYIAPEDPSQSRHVAYSISPAVIWTLPRINSDSNDEIVLNEEIVALYR